ncbi:MAG: hypothetical protein Q4D42_12340 [Eubacteriales bacterium]|nr:hypothetical protein [Eubacteriales bacterium]
MFKEKKTIVAVAISLVVFVVALYAAYVFGCSDGEQTAINSQVLESIQNKNEEYEDITEKIDVYTEKLEEQKNLVNEVEEYNKSKDKYQAELTDLQKQVEDKKAELSSIESDVTSKQAELDKLNGEIVKASGEPITVPSGDYTIGTDIQAGRYQISGSSNFVAYTATGRVYINTILGDSRVGEGDYIGTLSDGMTVRCSSRTTFTPVETN